MTIQRLVHGRITWINIVHPTPEDVEELFQEYPYIHPLNLEDIRSSIERPKIDEDDDYLFIVMHFPYWDERQALSRPSELNIIIGRGYVVTIHDGVLRPLERLWERCTNNEEDRERYLSRGANQLFYTIVDQLVDYLFPMLRKVDMAIRRIEESIFTGDARAVIRDIALTRRDIIALRRIIIRQVPIIEQLERIEHPIMHQDLEEYFGDIADHIHHARDIVDEDYEIIVGLSETADKLTSYRINETMRILTVISVIMLPLTLLSSIYGMNFTFLPLGDHPNGFFIISCLMVIIVLSMLIYFRRRNWL